MKRGLILIICTIVALLTFCSLVAAHPGHGDYYPEEITNSTPSNPTTTPSTGTSTSKTTNVPKRKTVTSEESSQNKNTGSQNVDNQAENQPYEEVTNTGSASNSSSSSDSESSSWGILGPILGLMGGFAAVGLLFKSGLLK
ncbi:MAG: hypothetical protein QMD61_08130 [Methanobacterium sp.]|nr:hypothetical protein [Methanobacterium sp.]